MSNLPRDDQLIVQGPRPLGPPDDVILGEIRRTCAGCGREWEGDVPKYDTGVSLGRRAGVCPHCGSSEVVQREVRPSRTMTILGRGVPSTAVERPSKPKVEVENRDIEAFLDLKTALEDVQATLARADAVARRLVNVSATNVEVFSRIQGVLNLAMTPGDFSFRLQGIPLDAKGIRQMLSPLILEIDQAVQKYQEAK